MSAAKIPQSASSAAAHVGRILDAIKGIAHLINSPDVEIEDASDAADGIVLLAQEARKLAGDVEHYAMGVENEVRR